MSAANLRGPGTRSMVTGLFRDRESAERAYRAACDRGYTSDDVNLAMSDETRDRWLASGDGAKSELGTKALEGTGTGAAISGAVGGTLGALAAIGTSLIIPGLGLVVAGPLAAGLAGVGAGGLAGGLIGALAGWGIPEDRARTYEAGLKQGGVVMGVSPRSDEDAEYIQGAWRGHGEHVYR
jgi:hypothetical protein